MSSPGEFVVLTTLSSNLLINVIQVSSGQLKFSVYLTNWPWTDEGQYLDIDVIIKVPRGRMVKETPRPGQGGRRRPRELSLGRNATAFFSTKVSVY